MEYLEKQIYIHFDPLKFMTKVLQIILLFASIICSILLLVYVVVHLSGRA